MNAMESISSMGIGFFAEVLLFFGADLVEDPCPLGCSLLKFCALLGS